MSIKWECKKCGNCCSIAGIFFPELSNDGRKCRYLQENNLCSIYERRPNICRATNSDDNKLINSCNQIKKFKEGIYVK